MAAGGAHGVVCELVETMLGRLGLEAWRWCIRAEQVRQFDV
jgi:hypothetical protein